MRRRTTLATAALDGAERGGQAELRHVAVEGLARGRLPTIKYYLREGLLPEGEKRTPRLTDYDEQHVRRLELLRILRDAGDVPVEGLKRLVAATETQGTRARPRFAVATGSRSSPTPPPASADAFGDTTA